MVDVGQRDSILLLTRRGGIRLTLIDLDSLIASKKKALAAQEKKRQVHYSCASLATRALRLTRSHSCLTGTGMLKYQKPSPSITIRQLIIGKGMEKIPLMQGDERRGINDHNGD